MKRSVIILACIAFATEALADDLSPPKLLRIVPGDSGVYVEIEKRDEDVERNARYCVYISETPGGPYEQVDRFWARLYKGSYGHTAGYVGHLTNGTTYYFVVTTQVGDKESPYSNEVAGTPVQNDEVAVPYIEGKWWRICVRSPDVAPCNKRTPKMNRIHVLTIAFFVLLLPVANAGDYEFDGKISRSVLENYLSRSITMLDLLTGHDDVDDSIRMIRNTGAKFAGRTIYLWGHESQLPKRLAAARQNAPKVHAADPDMILQACVFEIVSKDVEKLPIPAWAFEAFDVTPKQRNFRYEATLYPGGRGHNHWRPGSSIPDISQPETKLWFYFLAASYIDVGCEAVHFGQAEIMDGNDPAHRHWWKVLQKVREYAAGWKCLWKANGAKLSSCQLSAPPILDGMAMTPSRVYISAIDGSVTCLGKVE